jgi:hypothetical protein
MRHNSSGPGDSAPPQLEDVLSRLETRFNDLVTERVAAPALLAELMVLPPGQRELAARTRDAFHTPAVAELLIEQSDQTRPPAALELARLAVAIADRVDPKRYSSSFVHDLRSRAWAQLGEARRLAGDLRGAANALDIAEQLSEDGSADPLEEAHLLEVRAALLADRGDVEAGAELLTMAAEIYESVGDGPGAAQARRGAEELVAAAQRSEAVG